MNKPLSLVFCILALVSMLHTAYSQDTTKTQVPVTTTPAAKPVVKSIVKPAPAENKLAPAIPAPVAVTPVVVDSSLTGLYNQLLKITYRYQQGPIIAFHKHYMDTLDLERRKLREAEGKLAVQAKTIASLQGNANVSTTNDKTVSELQADDTISFLGISLSKSTYNAIMWGLVLVLGLGLAIVIFLSASNKREAAYRIQLYEELAAEFQTYKVKAIEKEKKLARELQTERNRLDDLLGK